MQDLNRFLRGWAGYFRYGNSAQFFDKITLHALRRLAGFIAKRQNAANATAGGSLPTRRTAWA